MKKVYLESAAVLFIGVMAIVSCLPAKQQHVTQHSIGKHMQYTGTLRKGKGEGKGILSTNEGTYKGTFSNGRFHGKGQFVQTKKEAWSYRGTFKKGRPVGKASIQIKDKKLSGNVMNGEFKK